MQQSRAGQRLRVSRSNRITGMPSFFALSARLPLTPLPGNTRTPTGIASSIWSLRLKGAAFLCLAQSGLNTTWGTLRLLAHLAAISSAPFGDPPCRSTMPAYFARTLSRAAQIRSTSLHSAPPVNATRVPAGIRTWASARRFALMKSRLSIIAAVRARWLTIDPERGRHADPVRLSVEFVSVIAEDLEAVAALDQCASLPDQPLQLDGFHLGAIL